MWLREAAPSETDDGPVESTLLADPLVDVGSADAGVDVVVDERIHRAGTRRWRGKRWVIAALVVIALALAGGLAWYVLRPEEAAPQSITAAASVGEVTRTVSASGTLQPAQDETLTFAVSGTVSQVLVELGDSVTVGQALARVDDSLLQSQLAAAESTEAAARDDLSGAEDGDSAVQLAAAQAQLTTAQDDLLTAGRALDDAVLRAPFDGQVVTLDLDVGDVVSGSSGSTTSAAGVSGGAAGVESGGSTSTTSAGSIQVASVSTFVVETTVSSTDLARVRAGLQAQITAAGSDGTLYGTVTEVGRVATTSSAGGAAFPVTVTLTGEASDVYGGTSVSVEIIVEKRPDVLTVPTRAVQSEDGQTYVTLVAEDGSTERRDVEVGQTYGSATEILTGLSDGDQVQLLSIPAGVGPGQGQPQGGFPSEGDFPGGQLPEGEFPGGQFPGGQFPGGGFPGGQGGDS